MHFKFRIVFLLVLQLFFVPFIRNQYLLLIKFNISKEFE